MKKIILLGVFTMLFGIAYTQSVKTGLQEISHSLDFIGWVLLFLGWIMYWLKNLDANKKADPLNWMQKFWAENTFELPISALSCLLLAILAPYIPTDLIDMNGKVSIMILGYSSSSILNGLLTKFKK